MSHNKSSGQPITISPKAAEISQSYVTNLAKTISMKIEDGRLEISNSPSTISKRPTNPQQDDNVKLIMREKLLLERKLAYLNKSIETKKASSALGKMQTTEKKQIDPETYQKRMKEIRKNEKKMKLDYQKHKQDIEIKRMKLASRERKRKEEVKHQEEEQRKQQLSQKIMKIKERTIKRESQDEEMRHKIKSLMKMQTVHSKLLKQQQIQESKALIQRKRKLQDLRRQYKPLDYQEITSHQQKFLQKRREREEQRIKQREEFMNKKYHVPYQSIFYKKAKSLKDQKDESLDSGLMKRQRMKQFGELLKNKYKPEINPHLTKEMSLRIQRQSQVMQEIKRRESPDHGRQKGLQYLAFLRSLPKAVPKTTTQVMGSSQPKYQNYLVHSARGDESWKQYLGRSKGGNSQANIEKFLCYSEGLQQKLRMKQQKQRILKETKVSDIDQKYIDMINAKLQFYNMSKND